MVPPHPFPALLSTLTAAAAQAGQGAKAGSQPNAQVMIFKAKESTIHRQPWITHHGPEAPCTHQPAVEIENSQAGNRCTGVTDQAGAEQWQC
jgi:hypothetical protein